MAQEQPNLVFLMKTKNKQHAVDRFRRRLNYQNAFIIDPVGIGGGLVLLWDEDESVEVVDSKENFIDIVCKNFDSGERMRITFVYAPTNFQERLIL